VIDKVAIKIKITYISALMSENGVHITLLKNSQELRVLLTYKKFLG